MGLPHTSLYQVRTERPGYLVVVAQHAVKRTIFIVARINIPEKCRHGSRRFLRIQFHCYLSKLCFNRHYRVIVLFLSSTTSHSSTHDCCSYPITDKAYFSQMEIPVLHTNKCIVFYQYYCCCILAGSPVTWNGSGRKILWKPAIGSQVKPSLPACSRQVRFLFSLFWRFLSLSAFVIQTSYLKFAWYLFFVI